MSGQWIEDRRERSGWRWDDDAPAADPSPTMIRNAPVAHSHELGTPRRDQAMSEPQQPQSDELVAFDPNDPHDPSIEAPQGIERPGGVQPSPEPPISVCPTCGTAVATDRLRG